jgi:hypothetical protein
MGHRAGFLHRTCLTLSLLCTVPLWSQLPRTLRPEQAAAQPAAPEARTALVIGNGGYREGPLNNPPNDARAMAAALGACGFRVTLLVDASRGDMFRALREFGERIQGGGVGLFYYAGHGMSVKGSNYLIPVGADIASEDEVPVQALDVNAVLGKMDTARNRLNILILDACRNNPFARSFRSASHGLSLMEAPSGTFVAFATAPGSTASDGQGKNGLYTQHILEAMREPGLKLEEMFKEVRVGVKYDSHDQQIPWDSSSLTGDFYFVPTAAVPGTPAVRPVGMPADAPPPPPPSLGMLQVAVTGAEAKVFLNDAYKGLAKPDEPLALRGLAPGSSRLELTSPGCIPVRQIIQIEAGRWCQVAIPMNRGAVLYLYRKPNRIQWKGSKFDVYLDGQKLAALGNKDYVRLEVSLGQHLLKVINPEKDMAIGTLQAVLPLEIAPDGPRCFRIDAGMSMVLTEVSEATWKKDSLRFESQLVEVMK